jgi:hypothetical protein
MTSPVDFLPTDQTLCYGPDGRLIPCANAGQDASFKNNAPLPTSQRFHPQGQIVRDTLTGAVWSRNANLPEFPLTWSEAQTFVESMRARHVYERDDWQLPSRGLLFSLISHQEINPTLAEGHPFQNVFSGYYWTADTCHRLPNQAWYVHLGGGRVHRGMKHGSYMVWPVSVHDIGTAVDTITGTDRFNIDGLCVHDPVTGLTWSRNADTADGPLDWQQAIDMVAQMNTNLMNGHSDWRLPTIRELERLVSLDAHSPALPSGHPFVNVRDAYWSSTTSVYEPRYAWTVYMEDGIIGVGFKPIAEFYLWPVRGRIPGP